MKVHIDHTIHVDNEQRHALAWALDGHKWGGNPKDWRMATRDEIQTHVLVNGAFAWNDLLDEYHEAIDSWLEDRTAENYRAIDEYLAERRNGGAA